MLIPVDVAHVLLHKWCKQKQSFTIYTKIGPKYIEKL